MESINKIKLLFFGLFLRSYILKKLSLLSASQPIPQMPSVG